MRGIAAIPGSDQPRFVSVPEPEAPLAAAVLCRTLELGICGTDREILESKSPHVPRDQDFLILGHECLARVEEVGRLTTEESQPLSDRVRGNAEVARQIAVGDLVVPVVRRQFPGQRRRVDMLAVGQFTERGIFNEHGFSTPLWIDEPRFLFRVPAELAAVAILTEPLAVAAKGVNEAEIVNRARLGWGLDETSPRVLVTGLGPIAFAALVICRARGWPTTVYGRDASDAPRPRLVREFGGAYLPQDEARFDQIDPADAGYDLILECTGSESVALHTGPALASCGVMVWLGSTRNPRPASQNFGRLIRDGLIRNNIFLGCVNAAPRDFAEALDCLAHWKSRHPGALSRLITDRVTMDDALKHYESRRPQSIKAVIEYW